MFAPLAVMLVASLVFFTASGLAQASRTFEVDGISALQQAIDTALPGDEIVLADGVYVTADTINVERHGTADNPIVIRAKSIGGAHINGEAGFRVRQSSHILIRGFVLGHSIWGGEVGNNNYNGLAFEVRDSNHIRISRNRFVVDDATERSIWLLITGIDSSHNHIDHNVFHNKTSENVFVAIYGRDASGDPFVSQHDVIEFNHFYSQVSKGGECLRIGDSARGPQSAFTIVRSNLFEHCVSDDEVISNKSSDNLFLGNTFRDNIGSLTLRHGNRNRIDGNFFIENEGGIRVYGHDHEIVNNYFEGNRGIGAKSTLVLNSGCNEEDTGQPTDCARPKRVTVAFNTLINNISTHLSIGASVETRPLAPKDCTIDNNIIQGDNGELVLFVRDPIGFSWAGNILYGSAEDGGIPETGFVRVDPELLRASDDLYRISQSSPARHAAVKVSDYWWVAEDMDGHPRANTAKDIGAERPMVATPTRFPLQAGDVGPLARLYDVMATAGPGGALDPDGLQLIEHGETVTFQVIPEPSHVVDQVTGSCAGTLAGNIYETDPITDDCTLEVLFREEPQIFEDRFETQSW